MGMFLNMDEDASRLFIQAGSWDLRVFKSEDRKDGAGMLRNNFVSVSF